jgi:amino acid transporter
MDDTVLKRISRALRRHLAPYRHSVVLAAIISAFAVRPLIGDIKDAPAVFSSVVLILMIAALYSINIDELVGERGRLLIEAKRRQMIGWVLVTASIVLRLITLFNPDRQLFLLTSIAWLLFFAFVTWTELRSLLKHREVTRETISLSVSVYLLIGLTWGLLYILLFELQPHAFSNIHLASQSTNPQPSFPVLIYFSLTTLATVGYGDITPLTLQARYAAVAEAISGQFYLAILVARLVAIQMNQSARTPTEIKPRDTDSGQQS